MIFFSFFALPFLVAMASFFLSGKKITLKELAVNLVVNAAVVSIIVAIVLHVNTSDTEIWNGRVAQKSRDVVSCSHGYPCNCHEVCSGSGKDRSCYTHCDTCYEHSFDVDWNLMTTNNERMSIERVDSQGISEPTRWTSIQVGEPTSVAHSYKNYIKGSPDTLFRTQDDAEVRVPDYPANIYDYYRLDRVILFGGATLSDLPQWNKDLSEINGNLGSKKQVNIVLVLAGSMTKEWFQKIQRKWVGGKKNDVVVIIGSSPEGALNWVDVMAWTDHSIFKVKMRDTIMSIGRIDRVAMFKAIADEVQANYKRKSMSDFKYLEASVRPSLLEYIIGIMISVLMSFGLSIFFWENDVFDEEV